MFTRLTPRLAAVSGSGTSARPSRQVFPAETLIRLALSARRLSILPRVPFSLTRRSTPQTGVFKHLIYSLNVDTGAINTGWPVDVNAAVSGFDSSVQSERGALGISATDRLCPLRRTLRRLRQLSRPARRRADEQPC